MNVPYWPHRTTLMIVTTHRYSGGHTARTAIESCVSCYLFFLNITNFSCNIKKRILEEIGSNSAGSKKFFLIV